MAAKGEVLEGEALSASEEAEYAAAGAELAKRNGATALGETYNRPAEVAELLGEEELMRRLSLADKADSKDFKELDADFWKPTKQEPKVRGVYMGPMKLAKKKYLIHVIAQKSKSRGKPPVMVRINGGAVLTNKLRQVAEGTPVEIQWLGTENVQDGEPGQKVNLYEVRELREDGF